MTVKELRDILALYIEDVEVFVRSPEWERVDGTPKEKYEIACVAEHEDHELMIWLD